MNIIHDETTGHEYDIEMDLNDDELEKWCGTWSADAD